MKKMIAVIAALILLLAGCTPKGVDYPTNTAFSQVPEVREGTPLARAFMEAVKYTVIDFANREDVVKPIEYISWNVDRVKLLSAAERQEVATFMAGFGVPFDLRGIGSGRTLAELQQGIEMEVTYNPETNYADREYPLVISIRIYKGTMGRGYYAYFDGNSKGYTLVECRPWESFNR